MNRQILETIGLDITYNCNFRCKHCFNSSGTHNYDSEMSNENLRKLTKDLTKLNLRGACICGGEPLLRKKILLEIIDIYNTGNPIQGFNMVSNGFFLDNSTARDLKSAGINSVQISLDGATAKTHNWLRGNTESFTRAINAINNLVENEINVCVACVPNKKNINEIDEIIELCSELGVTHFRMQPFMSLGRGSKMYDFLLDDEQYFLLSRKLSSKRNTINNLIIDWGDPISHLSLYSTNKTSLKYIHISAYGDILISPYLPLKIGNIKHHSIHEYFDAGLSNILNNNFVQLLSGVITDPSKMNEQITKNFPHIFTGNDIHLDLIEDDMEEKTAFLIKKYWGEI